MAFGNNWFDEDRPYVEGSVLVGEAAIPVDFLIDTGSSLTALPISILRSLGFTKPKACTKAGTVGGNKLLGAYDAVKLWFPVQSIVGRMTDFPGQYCGIVCDFGLKRSVKDENDYMNAPDSDYSISKHGIIGMDALKHVGVNQIAFGYGMPQVSLIKG